MINATPAVRPANACFSSGPCAKRPGWTPAVLGDAALGRSHRAKIGKAKLKLKDYPAAVRYIRQSADMNPEEPTTFYLLATALRATGHTEEAKAALRRVSELHLTALQADKLSHDAMVAGAR